MPDFSDFQLRLDQDSAALEAAQAKLRLAEAALLPKISIGTERILGGRIEYSPDITRDNPDGFAKRDPNTAGIELSWRLFDGLRNLNDISAAREGASSVFQASLDTRQKLLLEKADKALAVIRDRALLTAFAASVRGYEQSDDIARKMLTDGLMTVSDVALAGSALEGAKALRAQTVSSLKSSELEYRKLTGGLPPAKLTIALPEKKLPQTSVTAAERAQGNSPLLKMAVHLEQEAEYKARSAAGLFFPTVDLVGRYTRTFDPSPQVDRINNYAVLLRLRLPIFDPTLKPTVDLARAEAAQRRYDRQDTSLAIGIEAKKQYELFHALSEQLASLRRQVKQAETATKALREELKVGARTISELLEAEQDLLTASVSLAQARYSRSIAAFRMLATMGDLDVEDVGVNAGAF